MREWEINLRHLRGTPTPEGYELVEWKGTDPHLLYADGFLVREVTDKTNLNDDNVGFISRCDHCGNPLIEDWNGAHYSCVTCKNVTTACCSGAGNDGQSG